MRKIFLLLFIVGLFFMLGGCVKTHYITQPCPVIEQPPQLHNIAWVKIIFTDPNTGKQTIYYAIPSSEATREKLNIEIIREYSGRCWELKGND